MGKGGENSSGSAACGTHSSSDDGDQSKIRLQFNVVRIHSFMDSGQYLLFFLFELIFMYKNCHCIDAGRHMFDGNPVFIKLFQYLAAESDFGVHHCFFNGHGSKSICPGNSGNGIFWLSAGTLYDQCALVLWSIGVADIDRDADFTDREDRILMKYSCPHIRKFTKFTVGDCLDGFWICNNAWICDQKSGYIGPVFIQVSHSCTGNQRACDIRTAAGKCDNGSVFFRTVESRDDSKFFPFKTKGEQFVCFLVIQTAVFMKADHFSCIDKTKSQIICHNDTI